MTSELPPAVAVWRDASDAATLGSVKYKPAADKAAAAVIEADREAVRSEQAAELADLQKRYNDLGNLSFEKIGNAAREIVRLELELAKWKALVERLRWSHWYYEDAGENTSYTSEAPLEAADLIETQAREVERLREALEAAPIIGLWEDAEAFKVRQDNWLETKYRDALSALEKNDD
jgi:hypothetical protein